jgi:hypothetical protein
MLATNKNGRANHSCRLFPLRQDKGVAAASVARPLLLLLRDVPASPTNAPPAPTSPTVN